MAALFEPMDVVQLKEDLKYRDKEQCSKYLILEVFEPNPLERRGNAEYHYRIKFFRSGINSKVQGLEDLIFLFSENALVESSFD